jgi:hypothetical protein
MTEENNNNSKEELLYELIINIAEMSLLEYSERFKEQIDDDLITATNIAVLEMKNEIIKAIKEASCYITDDQKLHEKYITIVNTVVDRIKKIRDMKDDKNSGKLCYRCKYRGKVSGSEHSKCNHPMCRELVENKTLDLFATLGSVGRFQNPIIGTIKYRYMYVFPIEGLFVKAHMHGVESGWFNFPFNFDPRWLIDCSGFTEVSDTQKKEVKE